MPREGQGTLNICEVNICSEVLSSKHMQQDDASSITSQCFVITLVVTNTCSKVLSSEDVQQDGALNSISPRFVVSLVVIQFGSYKPT